MSSTNSRPEYGREFLFGEGEDYDQRRHYHHSQAAPAEAMSKGVQLNAPPSAGRRAPGQAQDLFLTYRPAGRRHGSPSPILFTPAIGAGRERAGDKHPRRPGPPCEGPALFYQSAEDWDDRLAVCAGK